MTNPIQQIALLGAPTGVAAVDQAAIYGKIQELIQYANGLGAFVTTLQAQGTGQYLTMQAPSAWVPSVPTDPNAEGQD